MLSQRLLGQKNNKHYGDAMNDKTVGAGGVFDLVFEAGQEQGMDQLETADARLK
jgi:hypothetical protein